MRPSAIITIIGAAMNLLLVSSPLLWVDAPVGEYLWRPEIWFYYFLVSLFCILEAHSSQQATSGSCSSDQSTYLPYLTGISILCIFWLSLYQGAGNAKFSALLSIIGCLFMALGITLRIISIQTLKRYFISHIGLAKNHRLITTGIYAIVRHPSELGLLLICFGVPILLSSIAGILLALFALAPLTIYRISLEEKLLQSKFKSSYEHYRARTPVLFPGFTIYRSYKGFTHRSLKGS